MKNFKNINALKIGIIFVAIFILMPLFANAAVTAPNNYGLVGYWKFDEATGTVAHDYSGNKNTATLKNGPVWTSGVLGNSLSFTGSSPYPYVSINNTANTTNQFSFDINTPFTITAWVYVTSAMGSKSCTVFSKDTQSTSRYNFAIASDSVQGNVSGTTGGGYVSGGSVSYNTWTFVSMVYNGSSNLNGLTLYMNGKLVATGSNSALTGTMQNSIEADIGGRTGGSFSGAYGPGSIDDVRVYNRALGTTELLNLYKESETTYKVPNNNGLVGYWKFDEGVGTIAHDSSGNGKNGVFQNSPTWTSGKLGGALSFSSSSSQWVSLPKIDSSITNQVTISAWIYPTNASGSYQGIAGTVTAGGFMTFVQSNALRCDTVTSNGRVFISSGAAITNNQWQFITETYDGSNVKCYVNANMLNSSAQTGNLTQQSIGRIGYSGNATEYFQGKIDDVRIYNRSLGAAEIKQLYFDGAAQFSVPSPMLTVGSTLSSGLTGLWTMDNVDTNWLTGIEADKSGNGNIGSLSLMSTTSSPVAGKIGQAMNFNGTSQAITLPSSNNLIGSGNAPMSVSMWVYPTTVLSGSNYFFFIRLKQDLQFFWVINNNSGSPVIYGVFRGSTQWGTPINYSTNYLNKWDYMTIVYNGGNKSSASSYQEYLNGSPLATGTVNLGTAGGTQFNDNVIGADITGSPGSNTAFFKGKMDDVRVYNRALSSSEVRQLYLLGH